MPRNRAKAHRLEISSERSRIRRRVLDELETVGPHRIVEQISHFNNPLTLCGAKYSFICNYYQGLRPLEG
jgi:hypothetical protein